jgi:hypothetical protein
MSLVQRILLGAFGASLFVLAVVIAHTAHNEALKGPPPAIEECVPKSAA